VSDEMDCRACHASGTATGAQPAGGWVWNGLPERDYRLNILRLHDEREFAGHKGLYVEALAAKGFNPQGLYRGVIADGKPVLCAACHASEALGAPSYGTIPSLTASMHSYHAPVADPILKTTLDHAANRSVCYRCHPGSATKCLRGAMGGAVAPDGSMEMQCQNCHGTMTQVGALNRVGWFMEPNCQGCHSGTATHNSGQIRFASVFTDANGTVRVPTDRTFATQTNVPAPGISLYRFSAGHGGLQCSACHGSTHAEFPSTHGNDNVRNQQLQGHSGVLIECLSCHATMPNTPNRGPHGMHSVAQGWISGGGGVTKHASAISAAGGITACQSCHGAEYRGTVLSRAQTARTYTASLEGGSVTLQLYRGAIIGCYNCHNGPNGDQINNSVTPTVANVTTNTINDQALSFAPRITGSGAILRVISQPASGSVGCSNQVLTYFPAPGFAGTDHFTYSVYDGAKNSLLATGLVSVAQGQVTLGTEARAPGTYPAAWSVPFAVTPNVTNSLSVPTFDWDFGDGSLHAAGQFPTHAYAVAGSYNWKVVTQVGGVSAVSQGTIAITPPLMLQTIREGNDVTLSWPQSSADPVIEAASKVGPGSNWTVLTNVIAADAGMLKVRVPANGEAFYRLRRVW